MKILQLNIGLHVNGSAHSVLTVPQVIKEARKHGVVIGWWRVAAGVFEGPEETTLCALALVSNTASIDDLSERLRQDSIAAWDAELGEGFIFGPNAAGITFDPAYFLQFD